MAKNLKISLDIDANTSQAKKEIQALQNQLSKLSSGQFGKGFSSEFAKNVAKTKMEIAELQSKLQAAVNVDTGKLDFSKFNASIKASGKTLDQYAQTLVSLGPEGEQAFMQLSRAISQSEIPIVRISDKLKSLQTTLSNTLRWQISSSVLHGFMGAIQSAYGYAQDLNESLNNIRIVTGQSTEEMAKFAVEANKSAIALSATTTAYTDAALIFYQQGLNEQQVKERTEATIKMANITGQSAQDISSQMTAIWNNFDDGSRSLDNYGDVIVKLGAETAASSEEIAQGMSKFAAVADTVGLSYDYAAAAVATVVAQTRQSADIVGTAFKTLFARLEGLKLGETLEDGVDLNKYSKALASVGVDVLDATGNLRSMDEILDRLADSWETMNQAQKVALAQTVGGVRQYTQLIALMDNYDDFIANVNRAGESEGYLANRQQTFEQSWEASNKRLKASWESLYQDVIKDNAFIAMQDSLSDLLQGIDKFIDSLGGLKGLIITLLPLMWKLFGESIVNNVQNLAYSVRMALPGQLEKAQKERTMFLSSASQSIAQGYRDRGDEMGAVAFETQYKHTQLMANLKGKIAEEDRQALEIYNQQNDILIEQGRNLQKKLEFLKQEEKITEKETKEQSINQLEYLESNGIITTDQWNAGLRKSEEMYALSTGAFLGNRSMDARSTINATADWFQSQKGDLDKEATYYKKIEDLINKGLGAEDEQALEKVAQDIANFFSFESGGELNKILNNRVNSLRDTVAKGFDRHITEIEEKNKVEIQNKLKNITSPTRYVGDFDSAIEAEKFLKSEMQEASEISKDNIKEQLKIVRDIKKEEEQRKRDLENLKRQKDEIINENTSFLGQANIAGVKTSDRYEAKYQSAMIEQELLKKQEEEAEKAALMQLRSSLQKAPTEIFSGLTQSVTNLTSAYMQLNGVVNIWRQFEEGEATFGQALTQTIMSVGMALPTLISTYNALDKVFKNISLATDAEAKSLVANTTEKLTNAAANEIDKNSEEALAGARAQESGVTAQNTNITKGNSAQKVLNSQASKGLGAQFMAGEAFGHSFGALGSIGAFAILAAAIIALGASLNRLKNIKEDIQNLEQGEKNRYDEAKAWREENKAILEQCEAYDQIKNRYDLQLTSREDLNQSILETAEALGIENAQILANAEAYDFLQAEVDKETEKIEQQNSEMLEQQRVSARNQLYYNSLDKGLAVDFGKASYNAGASLADETEVLDQFSNLGLEGINIGGAYRTANGQYEFEEDALSAYLSVDQANMSEEDFVRFLEAVTEITTNPELYEELGGKDSEILQEILGAVEDWGQYTQDYIQILAQQGQEFADREAQRQFENSETIQGQIEGGSVGDYVKAVYRTAAFSVNEGVFEAIDASEEEVRDYLENSFAGYFTQEVIDQFEILKGAAEYLNIPLNSLAKKLETFSKEEQEAIMEGLVKAPELTLTLLYSDSKNIAETLSAALNTIDLTNFESSLRRLQGVLDELESGASYTADEMDKLTKKLFGESGMPSIEDFLEEMPGLFTELADGVYVVTGDIEEARRQITEMTADQAEAQYEEIQNAIKNHTYQNAITEIVGEDQSAAMYIKDQTAYAEQIRSALEKAPEWQNTEEYEKELAIVESNIQVVTSLIDKEQEAQEILAQGFTYAEDQLVTEYTTYEQLQNLYARGLISAKKYQETWGATALRSAEILGINNEELRDYVTYLKESNQQLKDNEEEAYQVALAYERVVAGLTDLNSNFADYKTNLTNNNVDAAEYASALTSIQKDLQNIFNTDEYINEDFIIKNLNDIEKAAEGNLTAIHDLQQAYAESVLDEVNELGTIDDQVEEAWQNILAIADKDYDIGFEIDLNSDEAIAQFYQILQAAGASAEQIQEIFNSIGWELIPQYTTYSKAEFMALAPDLQQQYRSNGNASYNREEGTVTVITGFGTAQWTGGSGKGAALAAKNNGKSKSSSGGKSSKKDEKEAKDEFERYYTITRQIKDQEDAVNRLDKAKERAWGKAKLEYLDKESDALEKQVKLQEQYLKEIEDYYRKDKGNLAAFGATFDENGVLTNYETLIQQELDKYNEAVEEYNDNQDEAAMESAEKRYQYFQETLKQYDETNQLYQSEMDKLTDLQNSLYDMKLEKIQTKVEMDVKVNAMELEQLEYQLDRIEKKGFSTAEAIANMVDSIENAQRDIDSYEESTLTILKNHGIGSVEELGKLSKDEIAGLGFTQAEIEALIDNNSNLISELQKINEYEEKILNGPLEVFKEWNSEFDYYEDRLSHMTSLMKNYKDIAQLIYSNAPRLDNSFMMGVMNNTYLNMVNEVGASRTELEANKKALEEARTQYEKAKKGKTSEQNLKILEDNLREMEKAVETSEDNMLSKTQETLKQVEEMLKETVANAKETFLDLVSASDWDMTQFDRLKTLDDQYLDDYEKIYEFSKLTRDVNKSMQTIDTIRGQERLKEILEEMADIQAQGKEVSQYEVDALRKKYELRLAEIALEDQQNAKSMVRMARDNEGNWSYVYTADRKKVDDAQQKYEDKLYEYQKLNSDFIKQQQQNFLKLEKEYADAMEKIATDATLTEDQKRERLMETQTYYENLGFIMTDQLGKAISRNKELYELDWADYSRMTGYKISEEGKYQTALAYTYTGVLQPGIELATELFNQFTQATVHSYLPEIKQGLDDYKTNQEAVLKAAGMSMETYFKTVGNSMQDMGDRSAGVMHEMADGAAQMGEQFNEVINQVNELNNLGLDNVRSEIEDLIGNVSELVNEYNRLSSSLDTTVGDLDAATEAMKKFKEAAKGVSTGGGSITYNPNPDPEPEPETVSLDITKDAVVEDIWKTLVEYSNSNTQNDVAGDIMEAIVKSDPKNYGRWDMSNVLTKSGGISKIRNQLKNNTYKQRVLDQWFEMRGTLLKFDTGGYTGHWGNEGRLAFLHQKELVLNADDTKNMLDIVQFVRDIVSAVDTKAMAASVSNINTGFNYSNMNSNSLEQNVHIEASFPNATDHNEIELALTNLVNRASQYANRK